MENVEKKPHIKRSTYIAGYLISLIFTIEAYLLVKNGLFSRKLLIGAVMVLAISQLITQLVAFLHLAGEQKPRWNLSVLGFMLTVLIILVFGSLWIMYNLNYHMEAHLLQQNSDHYIIHDESIQR